MADSPYLSFLRDADQPLRRQELSTYFGPNAEVYLRVYDRMHEAATRVRGRRAALGLFQYGLSGPAFFVGPVWFFYRKLWVYGTVLTVALVGLAFLPLGRLSLPISLVMAIMAKQAYVYSAIRAVQRVRGEDGEAELGRIAAAGGVSRTAGWIGGVVYALLFVAGTVGVVMAVRSGQPPGS